MSEQRTYPHPDLSAYRGLQELFARGFPTIAPITSTFRVHSHYDFSPLASQTSVSRVAALEEEVLLVGHHWISWPLLNAGPAEDPVVAEVESGRVWLLLLPQGSEERRALFVNSNFAAFETCLRVVRELSLVPTEPRELRRAAIESARTQVIAADPALARMSQANSLWLGEVETALMDLDLEDDEA